MLSFFKDIYQYLLSPSDNVSDSKSFRKLILVKMVLALSTVVLLSFSFIHFFVFNGDHTFIAAIDLTAALFTLYAMFDLNRSGNTNRAGLIATSSLFVFFTSFAFLNQNESFGLVWLIFFPVIALTINNKRNGLLFSLAFLISIYIMAFQGIGEWQNGQWDLKSFLRLSISLALVVLIMYVHEASMSKAQEFEVSTLKFFEDLSLVDELTNVANRRRINELLDIEFKRAQRYQTPFALVLFDVDHFKTINDNYGHLVGDEVLKALAKLSTESTRDTETIGRWGGEEFVIILAQLNSEQARLVAEKLRTIIAETVFKGIDKSLTCSFGVAEYKQGESIEAMIECADSALYEAKESGRNQVIVCD